MPPVRPKVQGDLDLQRLAEARQSLGGEQGMATELEEVVVDADPLDTEESLPDPGDGLLGLVGRRLIADLQIGPRMA
jgi:hypothetical protein